MWIGLIWHRIGTGGKLLRTLEPSGSIKCGEFVDKLSLLVASQEGLCSME
jgi:hypothetical protein